MKEQEQIPWGWAGKYWMGNIWKDYKLTYEGFRRLWMIQDGKCAGCKKDLAQPLDKDMNKRGLKPEVDHKHVAGRDCETQDVRGLLCHRCNEFLGKIQDNVEVLQNLVNYLKQHGDWK